MAVIDGAVYFRGSISDKIVNWFLCGGAMKETGVSPIYVTHTRGEKHFGFTYTKRTQKRRLIRRLRKLGVRVIMRK